MKSYKNYSIFLDHCDTDMILQTEDSVFVSDYNGESCDVYGDKRMAAISILEYALKNKDEHMVAHSFSNFFFNMMEPILQLNHAGPILMI